MIDRFFIGVNWRGIVFALCPGALFFHVGTTDQCYAQNIPAFDSPLMTGFKVSKAIVSIQLDGIEDDGFGLVLTHHQFFSQSIDAVLDPALLCINVYGGIGLYSTITYLLKPTSESIKCRGLIGR